MGKVAEYVHNGQILSFIVLAFYAWYVLAYTQQRWREVTSVGGATLVNASATLEVDQCYALSYRYVTLGGLLQNKTILDGPTVVYNQWAYNVLWALMKQIRHLPGVMPDRMDFSAGRDHFIASPLTTKVFRNSSLFGMFPLDISNNGLAHLALRTDQALSTTESISGFSVCTRPSSIKDGYWASIATKSNLSFWESPWTAMRTPTNTSPLLLVIYPSDASFIARACFALYALIWLVVFWLLGFGYFLVLVISVVSEKDFWERQDEADAVAYSRLCGSDLTILTHFYILKRDYWGLFGWNCVRMDQISDVSLEGVGNYFIVKVVCHFGTIRIYCDTQEEQTQLRVRIMTQMLSWRLFGLLMLLGQSEKSIGLSAEQLQQLPVFVDEGADDCTICTDGAGDALLMRLPCSHHFHKKCIETWLQDHATCPLCRRDARDIQRVAADQPASPGVASAVASRVQTPPDNSSSRASSSDLAALAHAPRNSSRGEPPSDEIATIPRRPRPLPSVALSNRFQKRSEVQEDDDDDHDDELPHVTTVASSKVRHKRDKLVNENLEDEGQQKPSASKKMRGKSPSEGGSHPRTKRKK